MDAFRFIQLEIYSSKLEEQKHFYTRTLQLPLLEEDSKSFTCQIGSSRLRIQQRAKPEGPVHFAINIPSNQIYQALDWLEQRVDCLPDGEELVVDFSGWNAKAVYFYDADGNIVEFIARRNLNVCSAHPFSSGSLLAISEIGLPTTNISQTFEALNRVMPVGIYSGSLEYFCAAGSEEGLFIIVDEKQKKWFPTSYPAQAVDFKLTISTSGELVRLVRKNGQIYPE